MSPVAIIPPTRLTSAKVEAFSQRFPPRRGKRYEESENEDEDENEDEEGRDDLATIPGLPGLTR
jgi:hypothetical protein